MRRGRKSIKPVLCIQRAQVQILGLSLPGYNLIHVNFNSPCFSFLNYKRVYENYMNSVQKVLEQWVAQVNSQ